MRFSYTRLMYYIIIVIVTRLAVHNIIVLTCTHIIIYNLTGEQNEKVSLFRMTFMPSWFNFTHPTFFFLSPDNNKDGRCRICRDLVPVCVYHHLRETYYNFTLQYYYYFEKYFIIII